MKHIPLNKTNVLNLVLIGVTFIGITVTGILYGQSPLRILPLYISLVVGLLQAGANRYASLLGGINSILYTIVYFLLGLYASAWYALFFSCPIQIATFIRWSRHTYGQSTVFRKMTGKQRLLTVALCTAAFGILYVILRALGSNYQLLDITTSILGILISILTMLAYVEYSWLMLPSGIISIVLHITMMADYPAQITYLVFSLYSMICVTRGFFRVRRLYAEQNAKKA